MTISIGFDHRHQLGVWPNLAADLVDIVDQRIAINL